MCLSDLLQVAHLAAVAMYLFRLAVLSPDALVQSQCRVALQLEELEAV